MKTLLALLWIAPSLALGSTFDQAARLSADWKATPANLEEAALIPWPLLDEEIEAAVALRVEKLSPDARRAWVLDRALPVLAGELKVPDDTLRELVETLEHEVPRASRAGDLPLVSEARRLYARGDFAGAASTYSKVKRTSSLWPDALRERAWTLLVLGHPADALGATVSLRSPWFHAEDHAEARLLEANVLLDKCRWKEARERVAPLTGLEALADAEQAREMLLSQSIPEIWREPIEAPLVARVRKVLLSQAPSTPAGQARHEEVVALGERLLREEIVARQEAQRETARRALSVVYEATRGERLLREAGNVPGKPRPVDPGPLGDDEVAWDFDGRWWRDELGLYRYVAGDACPRKGER